MDPSHRTDKSNPHNWPSSELATVTLVDCIYRPWARTRAQGRYDFSPRPVVRKLASGIEIIASTRIRSRLMTWSASLRRDAASYRNNAGFFSLSRYFSMTFTLIAFVWFLVFLCVCCFHPYLTRIIYRLKMCMKQFLSFISSQISFQNTKVLLA